MNCPHCKQEHPAGARFCPVTGQSIPEQLICTSCGHSLQPGWKICPECGGALNWEEGLDDIQAKVKGPDKPSRKRIEGYLILGVLVIGIGALVGFAWWAGWLGDMTSLPTLSRVPTLVYIEQYQEGGLDKEPGLTEDTSLIYNPTPSSKMTIVKTLTSSMEDQPSLELLPVQVGTPIPKSVVRISAENVGQLVELARRGIAMSDFDQSPDGRLFAVGNYRGMHLYDASTLENIQLINNSFTHRVTFSPDGFMLASSYGNVVMLSRVSDGSEIYTLEGHTELVTDIAFSPCGNILASSSWDNTIKLWNIYEGIEVHTLLGHTNKVHRIAFSPDCSKLASGSLDNTVKLWGVEDGIMLHTLTGNRHWVLSVAFSPDGNLLASGTGDGTLKLWRVVDWSEMWTLQNQRLGEVESVAFSPNGNLLASGASDSTVKLWRVSDMHELITIDLGVSAINYVAFTPDGTQILIKSVNGLTSVWGVTP